MRNLIVLCALLIFSSSTWTDSIIEDWVKVDPDYVKGVYWSPGELPGWGFFFDGQNNSMFGAVYGYKGADSTFITLQGSIISADPLKFRGDVFFVTNGGSTVRNVGDFTWTVTYFEGAPAAKLTLSSNILDVTNLPLIRFSYAETDKVDMLSGANWNINRRILGTGFSDHYAITDNRTTGENGRVYAIIEDNEQPDRVGIVGYVSPEDGDYYAMLVEFNDKGTNAFYVFFANNTNMYGRYWLLDEGEELKGDGNYFRAGIDSLQEYNVNGEFGGGGVESIPAESKQPTSTPNGVLQSEIKDLELLEYKNSDEDLEPMFSESMAQDVYEKMLGIFLSNRDHLK
jgi:hypothetical protein